ncbi:MAG: zinc ribbon domain-containing protein [Firmicutes bacterium]|nr:zinc ribbon domain-containing protein [Bacillota bacterium]
MAKCAKCGAELIEGARFCRECGAKIEAPAVTVEKVAAVKSEIETTALSLRELTDKMLATYVSGMKDLEDAAAKARAEAESKAAEYEAKLRDSNVLLDAKTRELNELTEKYSKLQIINQQLQTEKFDAQSAVAELNNKVAALEQARTSLVAALNAQQAAAAVSAPVQPVAAVQEKPTEAVSIPDAAQPGPVEEEA